MFLWRPRRPFAEFACHDPRQALHTHPRPARLRKLYHPCSAALSPAFRNTEPQRAEPGGSLGGRSSPGEEKQVGLECCWWLLAEQLTEPQRGAASSLRNNPAYSQPPWVPGRFPTPNLSCNLSPLHLSYPRQRGRLAFETEILHLRRDEFYRAGLPALHKQLEIPVIPLGQGSSRTRPKARAVADPRERSKCSRSYFSQ